MIILALAYVIIDSLDTYHPMYFVRKTELQLCANNAKIKKIKQVKDNLGQLIRLYSSDIRPPTLSTNSRSRHKLAIMTGYFCSFCHFHLS